MTENKKNKRTSNLECKCAFCNKSVDKNISEKEGKKFFHIDCYDKYLHSGDTSKNLLKFTDYINDIYVFPKGYKKGTEMYNTLWKTIGVIIDKVHDKHELTYVGMWLTLKYMYENLNLNLVELEQNFIGLIPFYYFEAKEKQNIKKQMKVQSGIVDDDYIQSLKEVVYINQPQSKRCIELQPVDIASIDVDDKED